jgi:hypothetical protein
MAVMLHAGIVIHELAQGLSTRITGGPMNSGCPGWGESGGMVWAKDGVVRLSFSLESEERSIDRT